MNFQNGSPCLSVSLVDTWQIDFGNELNGGRVVWITVAAVEIYAVDSVLMHALYLLISSASFYPYRGSFVHVVVPGSCHSSWSSSCRRHRQDRTSKLLQTCQSVCPRSLTGSELPAPMPFSPFSSSSSNRKLRGIFAAMAALY